MSEPDYFKNALTDFTYEAANGGAIRHLTDLGFTVKQIAQQLAFPASFKKVQQTVWNHLIDKRIILTEEPGSGKLPEKSVFIQEYDKYGRTSFRRVPCREEGFKPVCLKEKKFGGKNDRGMTIFLSEKCLENGEENSYASCKFGFWEKDAPQLNLLSGRQREYILGLPWEKKTVYHRLDGRMREIISKLYENDSYEGYLYFLTTEEKVQI